MRHTIFLLSLFMLAAVVLLACGQISPTPSDVQEVKVDEGSYWDITPTQLESMLENKDFLFVNVHIPYGGEIAGTDLFVPYNEIEQNLSSFPENKEAKIVVYCRSGPMSTAAASTLVGLRFTNVLNLAGGMREWESQGYELIHKPQ